MPRQSPKQSNKKMKQSNSPLINLAFGDKKISSFFLQALKTAFIIIIHHYESYYYYY